ncbi:MAG: GNAT family N-acetyltransferase [Bacillota bacterium]
MSIYRFTEKEIVALDNNNFIGGISCEIYDDTLYISRIAVKENYRKKQIGKNLMQFLEKEAKKRNLKVIQLGTCEFQAKGFYNKLEYKIVFTRDNNPKGYKNYTMIKVI